MLCLCPFEREEEEDELLEEELLLSLLLELLELDDLVLFTPVSISYHTQAHVSGNSTEKGGGGDDLLLICVIIISFLV